VVISWKIRVKSLDTRYRIPVLPASFAN